MNHDEAVRVLKLHQQWRMGREPYDKGGCPMPHSPKGLTAALDYAIAYMEQKPQFNDILEKTMDIRTSSVDPDCREALERAFIYLYAQVEKLEKGQSDGK